MYKVSKIISNPLVINFFSLFFGDHHLFLKLLNRKWIINFSKDAGKLIFSTSFDAISVPYKPNIF